MEDTIVPDFGSAVYCIWLCRGLCVTYVVRWKRSRWTISKLRCSIWVAVIGCAMGATWNVYVKWVTLRCSLQQRFSGARISLILLDNAPRCGRNFGRRERCTSHHSLRRRTCVLKFTTVKRWNYFRLGTEIWRFGRTFWRFFSEDFIFYERRNRGDWLEVHEVMNVLAFVMYENLKDEAREVIISYMQWIKYMVKSSMKTGTEGFGHIIGWVPWQNLAPVSPRLMKTWKKWSGTGADGQWLALTVWMGSRFPVRSGRGGVPFLCSRRDSSS